MATVRDPRGPQASGEDYPECRTVLLYRGLDRLRKGDVLCMLVEEFLAELRPARDLMEGAR